MVTPSVRAEKRSQELLKGFEDGVYWEELAHDASTVIEPNNPTFRAPRAPTIQEDRAVYVPVKHDFEHMFDRPSFEGRIDMPQTFDNGTIKRQIDGKSLTESFICKKGTVNPNFVKNIILPAVVIQPFTLLCFFL